MTARDAILEQLDIASDRRDVSSGLAQITAFAGAERFLVARCDGAQENVLLNVVSSDWPFDLVRELGAGLLRDQARISEIERCMATLQPTFGECDGRLQMGFGLSRRYCVVPFSTGAGRMIVAFLFREGVVLSQERLGDAALMVAYLVDSPGEGMPADRPLDLTDREIECLAWIAEGKTSDEVSMIIGISRNTVNNYITSIMRKTATRTRSEAIALAVRNRLI